MKENGARMGNICEIISFIFVNVFSKIKPEISGENAYFVEIYKATAPPKLRPSKNILHFYPLLILLFL